MDSASDDLLADSDWYPLSGGMYRAPIWTSAPLAMDIIYVLFTIGFLVASWKLTRTKETKCIFFMLPIALSFVGIPTLFWVVNRCLYLADAKVHYTYPVVIGFFGAMSIIGKVCIFEVIFVSLHFRLCVFTPNTLSKSVRNIIYFNRFLVTVLFFMAVIISGFSLRYGSDTMKMFKHQDYTAYSNSLMKYQLHWNNLRLAFDSFILILGVYYTFFAGYLLGRASQEGSPKGKILILLFMVSPAVIVSGLYSVVTSAVSRAGVGGTDFWLGMNVGQSVVDLVTLTCIFGGIVWTGFKKEDFPDASGHKEEESFHV